MNTDGWIIDVLKVDWVVLGDGLKASYEEKNSEIWVLANVDLSCTDMGKTLWETDLEGSVRVWLWSCWTWGTY